MHTVVSQVVLKLQWQLSLECMSLSDAVVRDSAEGAAQVREGTQGCERNQGRHARVWCRLGTVQRLQGVLGKA